MKKYFYSGIGLLLIFELLRVYLIMPMPGSQEMNSIDLAYFLHRYRWVFRIIFSLLILAGLKAVFTARFRVFPVLLILITAGAAYLFNFPMSADVMFREPTVLNFLEGNDALKFKEQQVIVVTQNGESKAYPISYIIYHHQVRDTVGNVPVMVTYCSVCRTGRVYKPEVNGKPEHFRLVGMDHFNAMFEDRSTKTWWRQVTGEAVAGALKGQRLEEIPSEQMLVDTWMKQYPDGKLMAAVEEHRMYYDSELNFERGLSKNSLTGTDHESWKRKSWVAGITNGKHSKAYDWNTLKKVRVINDHLGTAPVAILLLDDNSTFTAYIKPDDSPLEWKDGEIIYKGKAYQYNGSSSDTALTLTRINVYQEFWHSWKQFHPETEQYGNL